MVEFFASVKLISLSVTADLVLQLGTLCLLIFTETSYTSQITYLPGKCCLSIYNGRGCMLDSWGKYKTVPAIKQFTISRARDRYM